MKRHIFILGFIGGILGSLAFGYIQGRLGFTLFSSKETPIDSRSNASLVSVSADRQAGTDVYATDKQQSPNHATHVNTLYRKGYPDLTLAVERSRESVVFIRNVREGVHDHHPFAWLFDAESRTKISSGSGVIFAADGYIVTNHHVIEDAERIEVIYQKRTYVARYVGSDTSTDIAVIKIEARGLPIAIFGNSDKVRIGEWVLAVGNPFNLTSTVTAGIVSAKGRQINLLQDRFPIESFIQTDAAINPGNSGGALVDATGHVVGINTAILSKTGFYSGYSFAVPINIVQKVVNDLVKYREVQRAFVGITSVDINSKIADELALTSLDGVLIRQVQPRGAATAAGIKAGDIILQVNQQKINSKTDLEELIGYAYPGDKLKIRIKRGNKYLNKVLTLLNREGNTDILQRETYYVKKWGIELETISSVEKDLYKIKHGVKIVQAHTRFFKNFPKNFIITHINNKPVRSPKDLEQQLQNIRSRVIFEGVTVEGEHISIQGRIS